MASSAPLSPSEAEALARAGMTALRSGDATRARGLFAQLIENAPDYPPAWFPLAQACRLLGDDAGEEAALDRHLALSPRHLPSLLMMGELKRRSGDDRGAAAFYRTALAVAGSGIEIAPAIRPALERASAFMTQASERFAAHLESEIAGLGEGRAGARIRQSVDLLLGRSEVYLQQPSLFYFPGLPQRPFYEREEFEWLAAIEAATPFIQDELAGVLSGDAHGFAPYVSGTPGRPLPANPLLNDPSWSAYYLWRDGALVEDAAARCPRTVAALTQAPIPVIAERSPMALFSLLRPGTHIAPHHGMLNTRLICHLPLVVPPGCALRVGSETRGWREGEALIFDDSFEHEAWNRGSETRVILLFEIWRPEIAAEERTALTRIFEAINQYQGPSAEPA